MRDRRFLRNRAENANFVGMIVPTQENPFNKKRRSSEEMRIQAECVKVAWNEFPVTRHLLFHVENETNKSDIIAGARRKAQGIVRGVADLLCLVPRGGYHGLCIEMKTLVGHQSEYQKDWQKRVEAQGYRYSVIRSVEDFRALLKEYLSDGGE